MIRTNSFRREAPAPLAKRASPTEPAEELAIRALGFIASDAELLPRFLALTGIEAQSIRPAAKEPGFLAGVLQFVVAHEGTLVKFAAEAGIAPEAVTRSLALMLRGEEHTYAASI